jgi:hypothetical protein
MNLHSHHQNVEDIFFNISSSGSCRLRMLIGHLLHCTTHDNGHANSTRRCIHRMVSLPRGEKMKATALHTPTVTPTTAMAMLWLPFASPSRSAARMRQSRAGAGRHGERLPWLHPSRRHNGTCGRTQLLRRSRRLAARG